METEEIDYEKKQENLLEQYLENGRQNIFKKLLNLNPTKKKMKPIISTQKINPGWLKPRLFPSSNAIIYKEVDTKNSIRNFDLYLDPKDKDKQMKGNTKWATQKFHLIKLNKAKRYQTPIDTIQFHKIEHSKRNSQIINGNTLLSSNIINNKKQKNLKPIKKRMRKIETKGNKSYKSNTELTIHQTNTLKI